MSISFNSISLNILTPGVFAEFDNSHAVQGAAILPHVALLVGQMTSAGSATANTVYQPSSPDQAVSLFGAKSQAAQMVKAYKTVDPLTELFVIPVADDGSGVAASGSITWTGTATEGGEISFYTGGRRTPVAVVKGDTAATLETNALAAMALQNDLPVTVAGDSGTGLDFTAVNKGTIGNQIFLGVCQLPGEHVPAGFTVTVTAMASGATDPSYSSAVAALVEDQYNTIALGLCSATPTGLFVTELESRWGPMRAIEGQAFAAKYDTRANLTTLGNSFNSLSLTVVGAEASALLPLPWELAAATAALSAQRAQVDPARALTGAIYPGFSAAKRGTGFTRAERDILLSDGISTVKAASDGRLLSERLVTTWQTNAQSIPDTSYQDLTTVRLLAALRYSLRARISSRFGQFKLMDDGNVIPPGQAIVTPSTIRGEVIALFQDWQDLGWVENLNQFKAELLVQRNQSDPNRIDMILPPDLINNLLVTAAQFAFKR